MRCKVSALDQVPGFLLARVWRIHYYKRIKMINQLEISMYLEDAVPEISEDLKCCQRNNAYKLMHTLINFTSKNIEVHNYEVVKRCLKTADKLYSKGNTIVKNAVENVFVFAFSRLFFQHKNDTKLLLGLIPGSLYTLYMHQVLKPGI
jgi:hypothetical protein